MLTWVRNTFCGATTYSQVATSEYGRALNITWVHSDSLGFTQVLFCLLGLT